MTPDNNMTRGEVTAFTFGYLNAIAEIIKQTITEAERESHNNGASIATRKLAAGYMSNTLIKVASRLKIQTKEYNRFMNNDIALVMRIIGDEATKSMSILDKEMERLISNKQSSNWREENR